MSLEILETQIRENINTNDGTLVLSEIQEPAVIHILENIAAQLTLKNPKITAENNTLRIAGTIDLLGISGIQVDLSFEMSDEGIIEVCTLQCGISNGGDLAVELGGQILSALKSDASGSMIRFSETAFRCNSAKKEMKLDVKASEPWVIAGDTLDISIHDVSINVSRSGVDLETSEPSTGTLKELGYSGNLSGTLHVGPVSMAISVSFPDPDLSIDIKNLDFTTLFSDIGLVEVADFLKSFTPVETPAFDIHIDYNAGTKVFTLETSTSGEWKILESPNIFLRPNIKVKRDIPAPGKQPVLSTSLSGVIRIADMNVEISATFPSPEFSIELHNLDFASILSDLGLTDVSDFFDSLSPTGEAPKLDIYFYYTPNTQAFALKITTSDDWMLLEQPAISLTPVITLTREPIDEENPSQPIVTTMLGKLKMGMISAEVSATFPNPTLTVDIQDVGLTSLISSIGLPEVSDFINSVSPIEIPLFDINLEYVPSTGSYTLKATTDGDWEIVENTNIFLTPEITIKRDPKTTTVPSPQTVIMLDGKIKVGSTVIDYSIAPKDTDQILEAKTTLDFQSIVSDLGIASLQDLSSNFSPPSDLEVDLSLSYNLRTKEFAIDIESDSGFAIPTFNFSISDVKINITQKLSDENVRVFSVDMHGTFNVGNLPLIIGCKFPGDFELTASAPISVNLGTFAEDCLQALSLPVPPGLSEIGALKITNVELRIAPGIPLFSATITTEATVIEFVIHKDPETGKWAPLMATPMGIKKALSLLKVPAIPNPVSDSLTNEALVLSNADLKVPMDLLRKVKVAGEIKKGINFQATFQDDLVTKLLNVDSLSVAGIIATSPFSLEFLASSKLNINLEDVIILKGFLFGIRYASEGFGIRLESDMDLRIGEEYLPLKGAFILEVDPDPSLKLSAYTTGEWKDPMGVKGITVNRLGVDIGVSVPFMPEFGVMADVTIGSFTGSGAISLKGPTLQLLSIEFNQLNIGTVVRSLLFVVADIIPEQFFAFLDGIEMRDVKFHYALMDTIVGGVNYNAGFHMRALLDIFDFNIFAEALLDPDDGIYIRAAIDPIDISINGFELIKLTHASDTKKGAMFDLDLRRSSSNLQLVVSGAISILGGLMKGLVDINIDEDGFYLLTMAKIFDLFEASLEVSGPSLDELLKGSGDGVYLRAYMKNDLLDYVRENILNFIKDITDAAVSGLNDAQNALVAAQHDVESWDIQISNMIAIVQKEQDAIVAGLKDAQNAVTAAQNEVNKIDSQIRSIQSRINTLNSEIAWWNKWYNSAPWWEKTWKWTRLVYEVGWRSAEITAHYVTIGALQIARAAAWAVLEIAKTALKIAEAVVVIANPALDPRVIALVTARVAAWAALKIAEGAVVIAREVISGFSSLTQFVVDWGLGGVFNITEASFAADFSDVNSRILSLDADIVFIGQTYNLAFDFNFDDPLESVKNFAVAMLKNAGIDIPL